MMNNTINDNILKMGLTDLYNKGKITNEIKVELSDSIDKNTLNNYYELQYSDFDQTNSTGATFVPASRKITNSGAVVLRTQILDFTNCYLKNFYIKSSTALTATIQFSYDLTSWYDITLNANGNNINEFMTAPAYFKISYSTVGDFYGANILYLISCNA